MSVRLEGGQSNTMEYLLYRLQKQIEEIGDCWEWQGHTTRSLTPVWRYQLAGKWITVPVRRTILLVKGVEMGPRDKAIPRCGNKLCVNPKHAIKQDVGEVMHDRNQLITSGTKGLLRAAKIAAWRREKHSALTLEQVHQIRTHVGAAHKVASQYGISAKTFNAIRRGDTWKDYTNPWKGLML
jgi:hypothetical protein